MSFSFRLLSWVLLGCLSWSRPAWGQTGAAPTYQWVQQAGGLEDDRGECVGVDATGSTYVSGIFRGTALFGTTTLTSRGDYDVFLAKYSASGQFSWVRQLGGPGRESVYGLTVEATGTVYVTGSFDQAYNVRPPYPLVSLTLENVTLTGGSTLGEMYLASYNAQGVLNWAKQTKGAGLSASTGTKVAVDGRGNVYVIGSAEGHAVFDHITLHLSTGRNEFVAKYAPDGVLQWVTTGLGSGASAANEQLAVDATGQCYVLAYFNTPLPIGGTTLVPAKPPYGEPYVAKLDAQGQVLWARQFGTPSVQETGAGLALDAQGNLLLAYQFAETVTHGTHSFTSRGSSDVLVLQYSPQGDYQWGVQFGGRDTDTLQGLSVDAQGNSYLALGMWGMSSLTLFSGNNQYYTHLLSLAQDSTLRWARLSPEVVLDLAATATGDVYTTGYLEYTRAFDTITLTSRGELDMHVAKLGAGTAAPAPVTSPPVPPIPPVLSPAPLPPEVTKAFVPNIITPNGDGANETFQFVGLGLGPWQLQVYSRWGRLVYQHENYQQDWGAADLPAGLYYYRLQRLQESPYQGWVEVVR